MKPTNEKDKQETKTPVYCRACEALVCNQEDIIYMDNNKELFCPKCGEIVIYRGRIQF